jgi:fumarylpyruvate hydrolase
MNEVIEAPSLPTSISIRNYVMRFGLHRLHTVQSARSRSTAITNSGFDSGSRRYSRNAADAVVFVPENQQARIFCNKPRMKCHIQAGIVVAIGKNGSNIEMESAFDHVFGYAVSLQVRMVDEQDEHCFSITDETSVTHMLVGPITSASQFGCRQTARCSLNIKCGATRSSGAALEMSRTIAIAVKDLSNASELKSGDLIFIEALEQTVTTKSGDVFIAEIDSLGKLCAKVV